MEKDSHDFTPDVVAFLDRHREASLSERVDVLLVDQRERWRRGKGPAVEDYLERFPEIASNEVLKLAFIVAEFRCRQEKGEKLDVSLFCSRFPALRQVLFRRLCPPAPPAPVEEEPSRQEGRESGDAADPFSTTEWIDALGGIVEGDPPGIGRFRILRRLGQGGFKVVYLGHDDELDRRVAIKVPHRHLVNSPGDVESYLAEARIIAGLNHPGIVPVYEAGRTDDGLCYVVEKYVDGSSLAERMLDRPTSPSEAAELIATVADVLHYLHTREVVHRDIKPGNILLDASGRPVLTDFGLALKREDFGKKVRLGGTPAYMSPEQAREEGHLVDGRSDIFSLGVVFYQLLTGTLPFQGVSTELIERITNLDPRPPRQIDDAVPAELERICLKALSKRATDRYTTARDMADELRDFLKAPAVLGEGEPPAASARAEPPQETGSVVPKGLRSFDVEDADFFLQLLPGPRDREGLPASLRFWKSRIEESDLADPFRVGLIYGPSGSGKTSLLKAGLLPRLPGRVLPIVVEATPDRTEERLLGGLRRVCPDLAADVELPEALTVVRQRSSLSGLPGNTKVLLIIDQFEQWLHGRVDMQSAPLVRALRQCDGERTQCILLVRDDFWMAVTRFMQELEIPVAEGRNSAAVDLFDLRHARTVLEAFGRAFGALPAPPRELTRSEAAFLSQAVSALAREGRLIPVRLALFAEMIKDRSWSPNTLKDVGGPYGLGVAFLDGTFDAPTAPPEHKVHRKAARAVLKALLPEEKVDIKGHQRSHRELLEVCGYFHRPQDFAVVMRILDTELRLVTPMDPEGLEEPPEAGESYYQLTHDYLIPSLREWLARKQKETRRGRAELLLQERSFLWRARPHRKQLPSAWEWLRIRLFTRRKGWTDGERKVMRTAGRYHAIRGFLLVAATMAAGWAVFEAHARLTAHGLRDRLLDADTAEVPPIVEEIERYSRWVNPLLDAAGRDYARDSRQALHISLALLPGDSSQVSYLRRRLLRAADPEEFLVIRNAVQAHGDHLKDDLWTVLDNPAVSAKERFRAACALIAFDRGNERWRGFVDDIVSSFVEENSLHLGGWIDILRPVKRELLEALKEIYLRPAQTQASHNAALVLGEYLEEDLSELLALLRKAGAEQLKVTVEKVRAHGTKALERLRRELSLKVPSDADGEGRLRRLEEQANVALALLLLGEEDRFWSLFKDAGRRHLRALLLDRIRFHIRPEVVTRRLSTQNDPSVRRALVLALGGYSEDLLSTGRRAELVPRLLREYERGDTSGVHSAAGWVLRKWGRNDLLRALKTKLASSEPPPGRAWYVDSEEHTMATVRLPEREGVAGWAVWLATDEVTVEQLRRFRRSYEFDPAYAAEPDCPAHSVSLQSAMAYCRWLSEREGVPEEEMCYRVVQEDDRTVLRVYPDYLSRSGYRLPTEAEWLHACRGGAAGEEGCPYPESLIREYGWYIENSNNRTWPVGTLKPNELGFFDMLGNLMEWCHRSAEKPVGGVAEGGGKSRRPSLGILQGGWARSQELDCDSRVRANPAASASYIGFRVARTRG